MDKRILVVTFGMLPAFLRSGRHIPQALYDIGAKRKKRPDSWAEYQEKAIANDTVRLHFSVFSDIGISRKVLILYKKA